MANTTETTPQGDTTLGMGADTTGGTGGELQGDNGVVPGRVLQGGTGEVPEEASEEDSNGPLDATLTAPTRAKAKKARKSRAKKASKTPRAVATSGPFQPGDNKPDTLVAVEVPFRLKEAAITERERIDPSTHADGSKRTQTGMKRYYAFIFEAGLEALRQRPDHTDPLA